jgi:hypothetical protein
MGPLTILTNLGITPSPHQFSLPLLITIYLFRIYCRCRLRAMSSSILPALQEDQVATLAEEAAAAVRAAMEDRNRLPGAAHLPPSSGGVVQMDSPFPPATERSKIIRINRQLNSSADVLGDAGGETSLSCLDSFHSIPDGRTHRSVLVENMADFSITTASFRPDTWRCISCSSPHPILPKKRNFEQWGGGGRL